MKNLFKYAVIFTGIIGLVGVDNSIFASTKMQLAQRTGPQRIVPARTDVVRPGAQRIIPGSDATPKAVGTIGRVPVSSGTPRGSISPGEGSPISGATPVGVPRKAPPPATYRPTSPPPTHQGVVREAYPLPPGQGVRPTKVKHVGVPFKQGQSKIRTKLHGR